MIFWRYVHHVRLRSSRFIRWYVVISGNLSMNSFTTFRAPFCYTMRLIIYMGRSSFLMGRSYIYILNDTFNSVDVPFVVVVEYHSRFDPLVFLGHLLLFIIRYRFVVIVVQCYYSFIDVVDIWHSGRYRWSFVDLLLLASNSMLLLMMMVGVKYWYY